MRLDERIRARDSFRVTLMGVPIHFRFNHARCKEDGVFGVSYPDEGKAILDPAVDDNILLDTAMHEIIEILSTRMEWELEHSTIRQLGVLYANALEVET